MFTVYDLLSYHVLSVLQDTQHMDNVLSFVLAIVTLLKNIWVMIDYEYQTIRVQTTCSLFSFSAPLYEVCLQEDPASCSNSIMHSWKANLNNLQT